MSIVLSGPLKTQSNIYDLVGESIHTSVTDVEIPSLSPFRLMLAISASDTTGLLGVDCGDETISLSISNALVSRSASTLESDDVALGQALMTNRLISTDVLEEAAIEVDKTGLSLAKIVFDRKLTSARNLMQGLAIVHERRLHRAMSGQATQYTFAHVSVYGGRINTGPAKVKIQQLVSSYLSKELLNYTAQDLTPLFEDISEKKIAVAKKHHPQLRGLSLSDREIHSIHTLLTGQHSTGEILKLSSNGLDMMTRLILTLFIFGIVTVN